MGGDGEGDRGVSLSFTSEEEESSMEEVLPDPPSKTPSSIRDGSSMMVEDDRVNVEIDEVGRRISWPALEFEANRKRRLWVYNKIVRSYDNTEICTRSLSEAKRKILRYTPGAWIEKVGGMESSNYDVPKSTTLILIGPKGSGKSSLINRISRLFEDDQFTSGRAQVSYNSYVGDGTYFLQEYMIPRGSTAFSLYDTRSLCDDSSENIEMIKYWMTKGVRHGEPVTRKSDSSSLKTTMKCKARQNGCPYSETKMVNFVIFVVNGLLVLKSMDSDGDAEGQYMQMIATIFNSPYLSFKDDKPVVVVTHGDLISISDRARIRVHLGEFLGIPPAKQTFDISDNDNPATELAIINMLRYCLEHADSNFPCKSLVTKKVYPVSLLMMCLYLLITVGIVIISAHLHHVNRRRAHESEPHIDWRAIRHLWLDMD